MRNYPIPFNEEIRITALREVPGLARGNEAVFDAICRAAGALMDCPLAYITVVEENSQWFKALIGMELGDMPKETTFCTHTIMSDVPVVVPDLRLDPKFADHPMVVEGSLGARFYMGVPLVLSSGHRFGALCVTDLVPHEMPDARMINVLVEMGQAVIAALERAPAAPAADLRGAAASNFLTLVGHELRTPLTVMQGALRLMEGRLDDPVNLRLAQSANRSAEHLGKLIDSILKFSDAETGELQLNAQPLHLSDLLTQVFETHGAGVVEGGKQFGPPECALTLPVLLDPDHIRICVTSLLLNSILHGGDEMRLFADTDAEGNIQISVHDTGTLEAHVELAELYKPFIVGGSLDKRATRGGLGLGLPLTRKLVELHGGEFEVLADAAGTTARIRLPKWRLAQVA